jgi:3D (Asp-Asp-Asp) domain-containing protein
MKDVKIFIVVSVVLLALILLPLFLMKESSDAVDLQLDAMDKRIAEREKIKTPDVDLYIADLQEQIDVLNDRIDVLEVTPTPTPEVTVTETKPTLKYMGEFTAVAYYKGGNGLLTATGTQCKEGLTVAVDPKVIPYGTYIYVEGLGVRRAEDSGGFRGSVIDIYFKTKASCIEFGKQARKVWIIE